MSEYRSLSNEELAHLEKEFIEFLILNGIDAQDWTNLKSNDINAAEKIIEQFSDVVFESIFRKVKCLELKSKNELKIVYCHENKMAIVGITAIDEPEVNFLDPAFLQAAAINPPQSIKLFFHEIDYTHKRELELFYLSENGFVITDDSMYKTLCMAYADTVK